MSQNHQKRDIIYLVKMDQQIWVVMKLITKCVYYKSSLIRHDEMFNLDLKQNKTNNNLTFPSELD